MILEDFNLHSPMWDGLYHTDDLVASITKKFLEESGCCCLNDAITLTFYLAAHSTFSSIDLTFCTLDLVEDLEWSVLDDCYTSDHIPILITLPHGTVTPFTSTFNWHKEDWNKFT